MRIILVLFLFFFSLASHAQNLPLNLLQLPPGFQIEVYAWPVPGARQMAMGTNGTLFVGSVVNGQVYGIIGDSNVPHGTRIFVIAAGLNLPSGVAFDNGSLYVAETNRIVRFDNIEDNLQSPPRPVVIVDNLPGNQMHGFRYLRFGPDGKLYVSMGMPCNACVPNDERLATISRMDKDGSNFEVFASGVRNSVGFDWDSWKNLWFTENGQDALGDNSPPDKLNIAPKLGLNFGAPYFDGLNLPNNNFSPPFDFVYTPPTYNLPAHVAPMGMVFYMGKMFPSMFRGMLFVTEHGSEFSTVKVGSEVRAIQIVKNVVVSDTPFITGWLQGQQQWGTPADVIVTPDGALLISDDFAGVIYRVTFQGEVL